MDSKIAFVLMLLVGLVLCGVYEISTTPGLRSIASTSGSEAYSESGTVIPVAVNVPTSGTWSLTGEYGYLLWNSTPTWEYYVYLPKNFNSSKRYAVIIGFHGDGGSAYAYMEDWENDANTYNFILAFPQDPAPPGGGWYIPVASIMETQIIGSMKTEYNVGDIFLAGCSAGAKVAIYSSLYHPGVLEGVASDVGDMEPAYYWPGTQDFDNATGLHYYLINGAQDTDIYMSNVNQTVSALRQAGAIVKAVVLNMGHECTPALDENMSAWFAGLE